MLGSNQTWVQDLIERPIASLVVGMKTITQEFLHFTDGPAI